MFLMRTICPTGSELAPNSLSTTVTPSTHTLAPDSTSDCVSVEPEDTGQLRMAKYSGEVPCTCVDQFWSSLITCDCERRTGATYFTVETSFWMARMSSHVSVGCEPEP